MDLETSFIDDFEYVKTHLNNKLNLARDKFTKDKSQENKNEYLKLLDDMRKLNLFDKEIVKKYLNNK